MEIKNGIRQPANAVGATRKLVGSHRILHDENYSERNKKSERRRNLDKRSVKTAPVVGNVFGDVNRRPAVFAAQRQTLQNSNQQQNNRRGNPNLRVGRQKSDDCRRPAHNQQRH